MLVQEECVYLRLVNQVATRLVIITLLSFFFISLFAFLTPPWYHVKSGELEKWDGLTPTWQKILKKPIW